MDHLTRRAVPSFTNIRSATLPPPHRIQSDLRKPARSFSLQVRRVAAGSQSSHREYDPELRVAAHHALVSFGRFL